jgi:Ca-activated chloride channel family protein
MPTSKFYLVSLLIALSALYMTGPALAASSGDLVAEGNRAYQSGKYDEALAAYEEASVNAPESPQVYFNQGAVYYMKGDYLKARDMFEQAALKSKDLSLEARSQYNLGNCSFRESERQRDSDLQKSLNALEQSIGHYQKALELDPALKDAAHNIEVARLTMKQIMDEIKKQQEQAKEQEEKQKQMAETLKELIQRQEELEKDTKTLEDEKKQEGDSPDRHKRSRKLARSQGELKTDTEKLNEEFKSPPDQPNPAVAQVKEHLQNSTAAQEKAERDLKEEKLSPAQTAQKESAEEMKKALKAMSCGCGQQPQNKDQGKEEEKGKGQPQAGGEPRPEERKPEPQQPAVARDEKAHDILDKERENREQRQLSIPGGYRPVDKDW